MFKFVWNKKRAIISIALIAILTATTIGLYQINNNVQAAIVSPNPPSGCVGWWRFDEGSGTKAADSSGNGNTGTIYGATWVDGKYGKALSFDGASSYVSLALPLTDLVYNKPFSVACWMNRGTIPPYRVSTVLATRIPSHPTNGFGFYINNYNTNDGHAIIEVGNGVNSDQEVNVGSESVPLGSLAYVVLVYDGTSKFTLYINGVLSGSYNFNSEINHFTATSSAFIGAFTDSGFGFQGVLDEFRVYNRALSVAEIQTDFQNNPGFVSQLSAKIPKGTTQVIATLSWQGAGSINATITSPSQTYIEEAIPIYQKTTYSTTSDTSSMLNIKRLSISVTALPADQSWTITLTFDSVTAYQIAVEAQK